MNNKITDDFDEKNRKLEIYSNEVPSLKEIALLHIRKISEICCNEFTKGYWEERPIKVGTGIAVMRIYHPDNRMIFCNAVDFLAWIVYPDSDKTFQDLVDKLTEEKDTDRRLYERKNLYQEMNKMFKRVNFFDSLNYE